MVFVDELAPNRVPRGFMPYPERPPLLGSHPHGLHPVRPEVLRYHDVVAGEPVRVVGDVHQLIVARGSHGKLTFEVLMVRWA